MRRRPTNCRCLSDALLLDPDDDAMSTSVKLLLAATGLLALGAVAWGAYQSSQLVYKTRMASICAPSNATQQDYDNFYDNYVTGGSSQTALSLVADEGTVTGSLTGTNSKGQRQLALTILDQENDLVEARAYLDEQLLVTATVQNGGIVVSSGSAVASMSILIPPASGSEDYIVEVEWDSTGGFTRSRTVQTRN